MTGYLEVTKFISITDDRMTMRRAGLILLIVTTVALAGCTETLSDLEATPDTMADRSLLAEGNAIEYDRMTVYLDTVTESRIEGTIVTEQQRNRRALDFRANRSSYTFAVTDTVPVDEYPPEGNYEKTTTDGEHPFIMMASFDRSELADLVANETITINEQTVNRTSGTFAYKGYDAFNISSETVNLTLAATEPYMALQVSSQYGSNLVFQRIQQESFDPSESPRTENDDASSGTEQVDAGTAFYIQTPSPQQLIDDLEEWSLVDEVREGNTSDVVVSTPVVRTQTQTRMVEALFEGEPSIGIYLPVPTGQSFTMDEQTYTVEIVEDNRIEINGQIHTPQELRTEHDRFFAMVRDGDTVDVYAKVYGADAMHDIGQTAYGQEDEASTVTIPMTISTVAADRFQQVLADNYESDGQFVTMDGQPIEAQMIGMQRILTNWRVSEAMMQSSVEQPQLRLSASDERTARFKDALIRDIINAHGLSTTVTNVEPGAANHETDGAEDGQSAE